MKKIIALTLSLVVALSLAACGRPAPSGAGSSEAAGAPAPQKDYAQILQDVRDDDLNSAYPIIGGRAGETPTLAHNPNSVSEEQMKDQIDMVFSMLGMDPADLGDFAMSISMMNVRAYGVGVFMPAEGKADAVLEAVNGFVKAQQSAFENYLPDQYEIAQNAVVKTLAGGEIILAMCEDSTNVADQIEKALQ